MAMLEYKHSVLTGTATTASLNPEVIPVSLDGADEAESVAIPEGKSLILGSFTFCGNNATKFIVQKTSDGTNWSDVAIYRSGAAGTSIVPPIQPTPVIGGGESVAVRVLAHSLSAPGEVSATIGCGFLNN